MAGGDVIYDAAGSGSAPEEAAMTLLGLPFDVVEGATWTGDPAILAFIHLAAAMLWMR